MGILIHVSWRRLAASAGVRVANRQRASCVAGWPRAREGGVGCLADCLPRPVGQVQGGHLPNAILATVPPGWAFSSDRPHLHSPSGQLSRDDGRIRGMLRADHLVGDRSPQRWVFPHARPNAGGKRNVGKESGCCSRCLHLGFLIVQPEAAAGPGVTWRRLVAGKYGGGAVAIEPCRRRRCGVSARWPVRPRDRLSPRGGGESTRDHTHTAQRAGESERSSDLQNSTL